MMEFKDCLDKGLVKKSENLDYKIEDSMKLAKEYVSSAEKNLNIQEYRVAYLVGYLSMFHVARALLFSKGYNEHSHYCLTVALKELFKEDKQLLVHINLLNSIREFREKCQYGGREVSESQANNVIIDAKDFLKAVEDYFNKKK